MSQKIQVVKNNVIVKNEGFAMKAEALMPKLFHENKRPIDLVNVWKDDNAIHGWRTERQQSADTLGTLTLGKGECVTLDFGEHLVGNVSIDIVPVGSPPDAPLYMKLIFGEMPVEVGAPFSLYEGWLSRSWLQEEFLHIDVLPATVQLERRYSFRFLKLEVIDTSVKYKVSFKDVSCKSITSGDISQVKALNHQDPLLEAIDRVSIKTLQDCMQEVFEDGPKRDRRLWLGDLRLQALTNYETFENNDLVRRCLYLFAAYPNDKGQVTANLFMKPEVIADDTYLCDYSLLFVSTLYDYYKATNDRTTLDDLWDTAVNQIELALQGIDARGIVKDQETWWSFIDWHPELNKQAATHGVLLYVIKQASELAVMLNNENLTPWSERIALLESAAMQHLWDETSGYFLSGEERQVSWASQIWLVLAGVLTPDQSLELLTRLRKERPGIPLTTPYMMHHFIEALILAGDRTSAIEGLKSYWGSMLENGADTFWELYDPNDLEFSPYGSYLVNSYCHAWSCTPTYLIRKYHL